MREAELEHLQREAEFALDHREVCGELRPFFDERALSASTCSSSRSSTSIDSYSGSGSASASSSSSALPVFRAETPRVSIGVAGATAPGTPPCKKRVCPFDRDCSPPKIVREREGPASSVVGKELATVCLPISQDEPHTGATTSSRPNNGGDEGEQVHSGKRRRICSKGGVVLSPPPDDAADGAIVNVAAQLDAEDKEFLEYVGNVAWPEVAAWQDLGRRLQRTFVWEKMKNAWCKMRASQTGASSAAGGSSGGGEKNKWKEARLLWAQLTPIRRQMLFDCLLEGTGAPEWVMATVGGESLTGGGDFVRRRVQSALYTWISKSWTLAPAAAKGRSIAVAVKVAKRVAWVSKLYCQFRDFAGKTSAECGNVEWATCAEVCTQTLEIKGIAIVHLHLLLRHNDGRAWLPGAHAMCFEGQRPHIQAAPCLGGARAGSRSWAGFFYCTVLKVGQVFADASKVAFRDFPVQAQWIMSLLQGGKIDHATARELIYKVGHGCTRFLADLDAIERNQEEAVVAAARSSALAQLAAQQLAFRVLQPVEAWDAQYQLLADRYKFLVLDGRSMLGKTQFAKSKCPPGQEVLEINCSAGGDPDLHQYRYGKHGLILCDEIEAEAVAAQRKLFQAGTALVQLGTSPTNIHVYSVFVHRVRIVCASNNWAASLGRLTEADRSWVQANSIYVYVDEPLFVRH